MSEGTQWDMDKINALPKWKLTDYVKTPEEMAAYLTETLDVSELLAGDAARLLAGSLGEICKDRGMSEIAEKSGLAREALYKALSGKPSTQPSFNTMIKVLGALGLKFVVVPIKKEEKKEE